MKTLDKVIEALDYCTELENFGCEFCPAFAKPDCNVQQDALQYLKAYREDRDDLTALRAYWAESQANPPLTWEELREMEGKPIWIELAYQMAWGLNDGTYIDAFGHEVITIKVLHDLWHLGKANMGKVWQAFRKERG